MRSRRAKKPGSVDWFHENGSVSAAVREWHEYLRASVRLSDTITSDILGIVDNHMLVAPEERISAKELVTKMSDVVDGLPKNDTSAPYGPPESILEALSDVQYDDAWDITATGGHNASYPVNLSATSQQYTDGRSDPNDWRTSSFPIRANSPGHEKHSKHGKYGKNGKYSKHRTDPGVPTTPSPNDEIYDSWQPPMTAGSR